MRRQRKSDSQALVAPQTQRGWGSPAISSGVAPGDLHRANVTASGAQAQGEDKHFLRRWSEGLRCPYHHEMGDHNYCRSSPGTVWLWQPPQTLLQKSGCGENLSWSHHRAQPGTSPHLPCQQCSCTDNGASCQPDLALLTSLGQWGMSLCSNTTGDDRSSELFLPCLPLQQKSNLRLIMRLSHASAPSSPR